MNVEIGDEAALFPEKEYINGIAVAVHAANLPLVSSTPAAYCHRYHRCRQQITIGVNDAGSKFTPGAYLELRISLQIFGKNLSVSHRILRGLGKDDSFKKSEVKHLVILSLVLETYRVPAHPKKKQHRNGGMEPDREKVFWIAFYSHSLQRVFISESDPLQLRMFYLAVL